MTCGRLWAEKTLRASGLAKGYVLAYEGMMRPRKVYKARLMKYLTRILTASWVLGDKMLGP